MHHASEPDAVARMRAATDRADHEATPMLLALVDARGSIPVAADPPEEGQGFAALVDRYRDELVPWARDEDQGALITVISTVSFQALLDGGDA